MGTKQAAYQPYKKQYNTINVELISLLTKLKAIPQNDITVKQGELLQKAINALQKLHKRGFHHAQEVILIMDFHSDNLG